ncbi:MAG TPA: TRAP transporter small permease [Geminicoccaceae bacterium]|nr:TRAP transporter small permease [Geminicoccaceae bacterium]
MSERRPGPVDRASVALALVGGCLLLGFGIMTTVSVVMRWLTSRGIQGDFELVQVGLAIAIFAFLPLCQLHRAHIMVDTFTMRAPARLRGLLDGLWALVTAGVAGLIAWRTFVGASETMASGTRTMVLGLPEGWIMALTAVFAVWLALVALVTAWRAVRGERP